MECERVIPVDVLDDLCSRFVINVPEEERSDLIRICFQIESAHWFYIDFYSKNFPNRKPCGLREFALQVFKHIPFLQPFINNIDEIIEDWKDYKFCVPTFGAILLDEDLSHVLLVQSYRSSWGFPKGKVNKDEPPYQCAIREVYEETGFDISHLIDTNDYIEANINEQVVRLYIIPGVKKCEKFIPKTRNEIKAVNWFPICDIPLNKKDAVLKQIQIGVGANNIYSTFYMVSPFLRKIRQWIYENRIKPRRQQLKHLRQRNRSCSDMDSILYRGRNLNFKESVEFLRSFKDAGDGGSLNSEESNDSTTDAGNIPRKHTDGYSERLIEPFKNTLIFSQDMSNKSDFKPPLPAIKEAVHLGEGISNVVEHDEQYSVNANSEMFKTLLKKIKSDENNKKSQINQASCSFDTEKDSGASSSVSLSQTSAFTKVVKSSKTTRRRRGRRNNKKNDDSYSVEACSYEKPTQTKDLCTSQETSLEQPVEFKPIQQIPGWVGFKFDIGAILKAMNDAVAQNESGKKIISREIH